MIPGRLLLRLAVTLGSPAFCERVVEPLLADFQYEWQQASGRWRALSALVKGYGAFWCTFALHAARVWQDELAGMSWRDVFPFPGILAILAVGLSLSHAWVTTGSIMNARFDQIDTRYMWLLLPPALIQRWVAMNSSIRAFALHATAFAVGKVCIDMMVELRPFMRGGTAFAIFLVVMVLVQKKNSVVEAANRD